MILMQISASVKRPSANILESNEQSWIYGYQQNVNYVILLFISQNLGLKSMNLERKLWAVFLTVKSNNNTAAK